MFGTPSQVFILLLSGLLFLADPPPDAKLFALPTPSLRTTTPPKPSLPPQEPPSEMKLTSESADSTNLAVQRAEALTGRPILNAPTPRDDPGGLYGFLKPAVLDPITNPEVIKVGKVQLSGGLVGAIKRKNPFYLLNPLVFSMDW